MENSHDALRGIGGWLLFFLIVIMVIGPAMSALSLNAELDAVAAADPEWAASLEYEDTVYGAWFVWGAAALVAWLSGLLMFFRKKSSTVWFTIIVLWLIGPALNALIMLDLASVGEQITAELWVGFARSFVPAAIWTAYLMMSERVANTYNFRRSGASISDSGER